MSARLLALAAVSLLGATIASAARVAVDVGTLQVFTQSVQIPLPLDATVEFTLVLPADGKGPSFVARIELPSGVDVAAIDLQSVRLCRVAPGCADGLAPQDVASIDDVDGDGALDLTLTFEGDAVLALAADIEALEVPTLVVSGRLDEPDRWFSGSAMVMIGSLAP